MFKRTKKTIGIRFNKKRNFVSFIERNSKDFINDEDLNMLLPLLNKRSCIYINGPSGVGKSYFCNKYCELYSKLNPDNKVYLVSHITDDPAFQELVDKKIVIRINIDETDFSQVTKKEIKNSLFIFDDTDLLRGIRGDNLQYFKERLLEIGRHQNASLLITSHTFSNYQKTRRILNEITIFVLFTTVNWNKPLINAIQNYISIDKGLIKKIYNYASKQNDKDQNRWVAIFVNHPRVCLFQRGFLKIPRKLCL